MIGDQTRRPPAGIAAIARAVVRFEPRDRYGWATAIALIGIAATAALAVFGLPATPLLQSPLHRLGIMDPLCGGTRAVYYAAHGRLGLSWRYNPLGILLLTGAGIVLARRITGHLTGRWIHLQWGMTRAASRWMHVLWIVALALLWMRQQLLADLLA